MFLKGSGWEVWVQFFLMKPIRLKVIIWIAEKVEAKNLTLRPWKNQERQGCQAQFQQTRTISSGAQIVLNFWLP